MFGILRPCRHSLSEDLAREWMSHMCGLCLALRDDHGQASRVATNYDGLVVSVLTAAQSEAQAGKRTAGRCPLRGMRGAEAADGSGAHLAAAVSLMLASAKITDHIEDGDGLYARPGVRAVAGRVAARWQRGARKASSGLGFEAGALTAVVDRQREAELAAGEGTDVLTVTRPTEEATGEAFAHTAVLAGVPANAAPLQEAGRLFGRVAHLLDAVEDREEDLANHAWNPLTATGTPVSRARELCDDAVLGVELALGEVAFTDDRLVRVLLVQELRRAVARAFAHGGHPAGGDPLSPGHPLSGGHQHGPDHGGPEHHGPGHGHSGHGHDGRGSGGHGSDGSGPAHISGKRGCCTACVCGTPELTEPPHSRGILAGCATALFMCGTCQFCCRDPHPGPWSGEPRDSWCDACECVGEACGSCCDAVNCCKVCKKCDCECDCCCCG
ncbi:MAG: regulator [Nocardiopsis sp. BM-2018]|nr:MAG: regulator [Nocardiopsis sp. BM-2018]